MQKQFKRIVVSIAVLALVAQPTHAVEQAILTDAQIESIRADCQTVIINLDRVHRNDAVLRINLGQRYETIARKLMAPLNSRIASNSLDGVDLASTTVKYNTTYREFGTGYRNYEATVAKALDTDCKEKPVEFYALVEQAREKRLELAKTVDSMQRLAEQYRDQVDEFSEQLSASTGAGQ